MSLVENTATLPPIIEDECEDNLLQMIYQKEIERRDNGSPLNRKGISPQTNELPLPYNSWKARNKMMSRVDNRVSSDMVSRLGQSLENCHSVVSGMAQNVGETSNNQGIMHDQRPYSAFEMHNTNNQTMQEVISVDPKINPHMYQHKDLSESYPLFDPNLMQNTPNRIFSGNSSSRCQGFPPNNMFCQERNGRFHAQSAVTSPYENANISHPVNKSHPAPTTLYSPHSFSPVYHHPEKISFPNNCCQVNFPSQDTYRNSVRPSERTHFNHENINFNGNHHAVPSRTSPESPKMSCNCCHPSEVKNKKTLKTDKNTTKKVKDLYKIVWLQNQQIIQLQNEVKKLIEYNVKQEEKNSKTTNQDLGTKKQTRSTTEKRMFNLHVIEENKNLMEKVSVGIMTSFIDTKSVKKDTKKNKELKKKRETESEVSSKSSSNESYSSSESLSEEKETVSRKPVGKKKYKSIKHHEDSFALKGIEIPTFNENIPSPSSSIHVDMQDYMSSSPETSDASDSDESAATPVPVGWTFYDKVVGKVNNLLNDSKTESEESENEVRNKTLEQLRKLRVSMEEHPTSKRVTFDQDAYIHRQQQQMLFGESDTSVEMNALAIKYLQKDEGTSNGPVDRGINCSSNNTNLSLATLRYLEKYHLLPRTSNSPQIKTEIRKSKKGKNTDENKTHKKRRSKTNEHSGNILDITAIKQQPKLLPKNY